MWVTALLVKCSLLGIDRRQHGRADGVVLGVIAKP
jgi:hypothetical protein